MIVYLFTVFQELTGYFSTHELVLRVGPGMGKRNNCTDDTDQERLPEVGEEAELRPGWVWTRGIKTEAGKKQACLGVRKDGSVVDCSLPLALAGKEITLAPHSSVFCTVQLSLPHNVL